MDEPTLSISHTGTVQGLSIAQKQEITQHFHTPILIVHSKDDYEIAMQIKKYLEEHGIPIKSIGGNIARDAIKTSNALIYLASPSSRSSNEVANEIHLAEIYKRPIQPLLVDGDKWADVVIPPNSGENRPLVNDGHGSTDPAQRVYSAKGLEPTYPDNYLPYIDVRGEKYETEIYRAIQILKNLPGQASSNSLVEEPISDSPEGRPMPKNVNKAMLSPSVQKSLYFMFFLVKWVKSFLSKRPDVDITTKIYHSDQSIHNPYKGLDAFRYEDAQYFFGRERVVDAMVQQVKHILYEEKRHSQSSRCILVVGASGAGKSSVVMAGLLPALQHKLAISEIKRWFLLEPITPEKGPIDALARTFNLPFMNSKDVGLSSLNEDSSSSLREKLDEPSSRGLHRLLQIIATNANERVVLVIDQFEEIFAPEVDPIQREQFINLLSATATEPHNRVLIIVTLRADFYDYILKNSQLLAMMKEHRIDIPPMTSKELRAVIEEPVRHSNITFDPDLVGDLVYEIYKRPEDLPLLQFTLEELFRYREGRHLTRRSYDNIGGLQEAINKHADKTYTMLRTDSHRECARELFTKHLIYIMESQDELSRLEITRRRVTRVDLERAGEPQKQIRRETIEAFIKARLLTVKNSSLEDTTYEISHEVLINAWKLLREWIEAGRKDIYLIQRLRPRMAQWGEENNRKKKRKFLVEGRELEQLQEYKQRHTLDRDEADFLQQSLRQQTHNSIKYVGTILLVALLVFGVVTKFYSIIFPDPAIVTSPSDAGPGSLRQVIKQVPPGARITFASSLKGQRIHLTSDLIIKQPITLQGPVDGNIGISSDNTGKNIQIGPQGDVTFENLMFADSHTIKTSIIENDGILTLNNCYIRNNSSYGIGGGGILNKGYLNLNKTVASGNTTSGNGGGINNLFGTVNILNNSQIVNNTAYNDGGGIYSQGGHMALSQSQVSDNTTDTYYGGGIDVVNGSLDVSDTNIFRNTSDSYGGGIAVQGSVAFISDSTIHDNTAHMKGGGIMVTKNTDNNFPSLVMLRDITITKHARALHYIGNNTGGNDDNKDIAGNLKYSVGDATLQISDDDKVSPSANHHPAKLLQDPNYFLGVADINQFCLEKGYSYGNLDRQGDKNADDIMFTCFTLKQEPSDEFSGQKVCQAIYPTSVVDLMMNYPDPTSLQCYKNLKKRGTIGNKAEDFGGSCSAGVYNNKRTTAYDWKCKPKDNMHLPSGLSVTDACNTKYLTSNAVDRLVNYNRPDGWECWAPA